MTDFPTTTGYPSLSPPSLSDDNAVFLDDDIIGRMIQVELNPFQLLFLYNSTSSSSLSPGAKVARGTHPESDVTPGATKILKVTREYLTQTLDMLEDAPLHSLELFPIMTERDDRNNTSTTRMMTFAGSAFFDQYSVDEVLLQDRVDQVTMLAFLGTNLTRYTQLLQKRLNVSIAEAQLYTIHGYRMAYTNGSIHVEVEHSQLLHGEADATVRIYLVAIGILSLVGLSLLLIGGRHVMVSKLHYSRANP